jgi:aldehyde:ferredoxin oxidoreductase
MMANWECLDLTQVLSPTELSPSKVRMVHELGLWKQMPNHLGLCSFMPWNVTEVREAVEAVTGWQVTSWKLMKAVERGMTMMRLFNLREGLSREDDRLPERFYVFPSKGPLKDVKIDPDVLKEAQEMYYQMMGWDINGIPTKGCLAALELDSLKAFPAEKKD